MIHVDATDRIAGRLSSKVAKLLLKGEEVMIFNAEKSVISGPPEYSFRLFKERVERGDPYHGPFYPKKADRMLKRMVRGMIPYKKPKGRDAFKRLKVFNSVPEEFKDVKFADIEGTVNQHRYKFVTLGDVSRKVGGKA